MLFFMNPIVAFSYRKGIEVLINIAPYAELFFTIGDFTFVAFIAIYFVIGAFKLVKQTFSR